MRFENEHILIIKNQDGFLYQRV